VTSRLVLDPSLNLASALEDLEGFSHLWVIGLFHDNQNERIHTKIHPPRKGGDRVGLFASRSPHRPNPISLSVAKISQVSVSDGWVEVTGLDLLNRTPILDLKPYVLEDRIDGARFGWTESAPRSSLEPSLSPRSQAQLDTLFGELASLKSAAICEILQLDPRPLHYRERAGAENPYTTEYGFRFGDWNVVFHVDGVAATVSHLEPWSDFLRRRKE
jgi:tRNA-Thr(GGU) m(6)t(6)A37 methyltransferase TsaA